MANEELLIESDNKFVDKELAKNYKQRIFLLAFVVLIIFSISAVKLADYFFSKDLIVGKIAVKAAPTDPAIFKKSSSSYSVGNYVYEAHAISDSISITDNSDPAGPYPVVSLAVNKHPDEIIVVGNYAYVSGAESISVIDVSNPMSPSMVRSIPVGDYPHGIYIEGNYAYVPSIFSNTFSILDISNPINIHIVGTVVVGKAPWGSVVSNNYAYVINQDSNDVSVVDISNPSSPVEVNRILLGKKPQSIYISNNIIYVKVLWSDVVYTIDISKIKINKTVKEPTVTSKEKERIVAAIPIGDPIFGGLGNNFYVSGNYIYIVNSMSNLLLIVNISNPANPIVVGSLAMSGTLQEVCVSGMYAYVTNQSGNFFVVNVANPSSPIKIATLDLGGVPGAIYVSGTKAYVANPELNIISVINISNPIKPVHQKDYPLNNSGFMYVLGKYAYIADVNSISILDIDTMNTIKTISVGKWPKGIGVSGNYAYVASYLSNNVSVIDISNPLKASVVNTFTTGQNPQGIYISGNYIYVTNQETDNISIADISNPLKIEKISGVYIGADKNILDIYVSNNYAYVTTSQSNEFLVVDISNLTIADSSNDSYIFSKNHKQSDCIRDGGEVFSIGLDLPVCKFKSGYYCPEGWVRYKNYSKTESALCVGDRSFENNSKNTPYHEWGNIDPLSECVTVKTCGYNGLGCDPQARDCCSKVTESGCI